MLYISSYRFFYLFIFSKKKKGNNALPGQGAGCQVRENVMVITKSAAKKVQRLQTMKCFDCIHLLVQKWKSTEHMGIARF